MRETESGKLVTKEQNFCKTRGSEMRFAKTENSPSIGVRGFYVKTAIFSKYRCTGILSKNSDIS